MQDEKTIAAAEAARQKYEARGRTVMAGSIILSVVAFVGVTAAVMGAQHRAIQAATNKADNVAALVDAFDRRISNNSMISTANHATLAQMTADEILEADPAPEQYTVALDNSNVRELPSTDSKIVRTLQKGDLVTVLWKVEGQRWYRIEGGYMHEITLHQP